MQITSKQQEKIVLELLLKNGIIDNFYCIDKRITTRLGVIFIIFEIKVMK